MSIKEYYSNYIDYTACNISLYLPFVGFVPILPEYVLNGKLRVVYRFNILDGSFCAWVLSTSSKSSLKDSVIGSFSGNCCVHIPISATNYSNVISGLVGGVSSMLNALPSKGDVSVEGAVDSASSIVQSLKPEVALSNGYNATLGGESRKTVFLNKNESDKLVELYKNGVALREIAKILGHDPATISKKLSELGYHFKDYKKGFKICQINKNTNELINVFQSAIEAGRYLGDESMNGHIGSALTGKRKTAYGYKWMYSAL